MQNVIYNTILDNLALGSFKPVFAPTTERENLIAERVRKVVELTTKTEQDVGSYHEGGDFSVEGAICAQVEREDLIRWSRREEDRPLVAGLPEPQAAPYMALWNFMRGVMP